LKPALVTGASGFLGWHVARKLIGRGDRVRGLVRKTSRLLELDDVEPVTGDLRDEASLRRAVEGCGTVYHVAADYRLWARDVDEMYRSNVDGTRNLVAAARAAGVERFVYTSTVGCIGIPKSGVGDETTPVGLEQMKGAYKRSKFLAERVVLEAAAEGFPAIVVNPTAPIGDHDFKPTPTGKIVQDFLRGALPAFVDTGLNLVDAGDVAEGHVLACEKGRVGERYILGCENLTLREILERLAALSGRTAPKIQIPFAMAYAVAAVSTGISHITGKAPLAPLDAVRMARKKMWVTHSKAARELGFSPAPVENALRKAIDWFSGPWQAASGG
jgi:dihydroflavonol-4-reductase